MTGNSNWTDPSLLQGYLNYYQSNLAQDRAVSSALLIYGGSRVGLGLAKQAGSALAARIGGSFLVGPETAAGAFAFGFIVRNQTQVDQSRVNALKARIKQIRNCGAGS
ncbi:hypothetical protein [Sphingomonas oryzagri]